LRKVANSRQTDRQTNDDYITFFTEVTKSYTSIVGMLVYQSNVKY